ncbi:succinate dehydrogenase cytochrome b558 subunit [Bacillus rubiinfantis]|uniref:succinate dehydrogenase cytochrome b558 subunit n=1 Tax=Bacillus rubiinfantis TaxID=1499680 RepID=UPI0005A7B6D8|nr:succinate dehydrogenase cytochrome b558 subunit [Bacillus rubiinfantis]
MEGKHQHFFRKLHSLLGIIPVGVFMTVHLFVNYSAVWGIDSYNKAAGFMVNLPFKYFLETFVIFLPLLFHGIYGAYIAFKSKNNVGKFNYGRNWKFFFQRLTGVIALVFIIWHVWETKAQVEFNGVEANYNLMAGIVDNAFALTLYIIGILSCVYHFVNGIWTFLITWGISASPKSQKITEYIAIVLFFGLAFVGIRAILAFA